MMSEHQTPRFAGVKRAAQEFREAYASVIWRPLVRRLRPVLEAIVYAWQVLGISRLAYRSIWLWLGCACLILATVGFASGWLGLMLAEAGVDTVEHVWDAWVLAAYDWMRLQDTWWFVMGGVMFATWLFIRPLSAHRRGARYARLGGLLVSYGILATVSVVLAWRFQSNLSVLEWWLALIMFVFCHFLFIFSIAVGTSITSKIHPLNKAYLEATEAMLEKQEEPLAHLFEGSLYGYIIRAGVGGFLDDYVGRWMGDTRGYRFLRRSLVGLMYLLSFAWLIDRIFGAPRYVQHFNALLEWRAKNALAAAYQTAQADTLVPAMERAVSRFDTEYVPYDKDLEA